MKKVFLLIGLLVVLSGCGEPQQTVNKEIEKQKEEVEVAVKENVEKEVKKEEIIIDVNKISGKSLEEIEKSIGKSEKTESTKISAYSECSSGCNKHFFKQGKYEIVFVKNKATRITITPEKEFDLNDDSIKLLGLAKTKPSFKNKEIVSKWENLNNIKEISFFDNGLGKIDYIYIINN